MKGKWTEIYTKRTKDIPRDYEKSHGTDHGEGWACTCGCNRRVPHRRHSEGPPVDLCRDGYIPSTGGASEQYRRNYDLIDWTK